MTRLAALALLLATAVVCCAQESSSTLKVDVKLVNVFVTVTDQHGSPVANLKKEDFNLKEDGRDQKIAVFNRESALPLSIVLAIDTSLSTRRDLPLELQSARRFAHAILRPVDALSVYSFSEVVSEVVPFTSDVKQIDRGVDRIRLGDQLKVRLPSGAERVGTVFYKAMDASFATQRDVSRTKRDIKTFEVRLRLDNSDRRLAVGMTTYIELPVT